MTVLYRVYRPQKFSDLVGQEAISRAILAQLETGKIGHAYLFYGPKGTGKTSTARILAKAVNCERGLRSEGLGMRRKEKLNSKLSTLNSKLLFSEPCNKCSPCLAIVEGSFLDLIEIDAASNRGIDEIRDLREKIKLSPISGRFKVYIIDEAHMLTSEAFNALLKTLEEPPAHAIFILCTTEIGKLPLTIVSRMQKFHFARAGAADLVKVVEKIAKSEGIKIESDAARAIAEVADGSYRDATSIIDQLSSMKKVIKVSDVVQIARIGGWDQMYLFVENIASKKLKDAVLTVEKMSAEGADISYFAKQTILFLEKLLFIKIGIFDETNEDYSQNQIEKMKNLSAKFESQNLQNLMKLFLVAEGEIKIYPLPQIPLVLAVCKYIPQEEVQEVREVEEVREVSQPKAGRPLDEQEPGESKRAKKRNKSPESPKLVSPKVTKNSNGSNAPGDKAGTVVKSKSLEKVIANWEKFLAGVKPINAHVVALLRSSKPIEFDGVNLTMEVFYRFHKEKLEEPKIVKMLDEVMQEIIAMPVKLRFVLAAKGERPTRAVEKSNVVDIDTKDIAKMAAEIFSK